MPQKHETRAEFGVARCVAQLVAEIQGASNTSEQATIP
jgi:hypothetical protein